MKRGSGGAPTKYTEAIAAEICNRLCEGEPLRVICRDGHMPAWRTVHDWKTARPEFATRYQAARDMGMDAIAEEALVIADTPMMGVIKTRRGRIIERREEDMLGHRRLQIETRLKLLAKWNPKKYGDAITHKGDPDAPVQLILSGSDIHG